MLPGRHPTHRSCLRCECLWWLLAAILLALAFAICCLRLQFATASQQACAAKDEPVQISSLTIACMTACALAIRRSLGAVAATAFLSVSYAPQLVHGRSLSSALPYHLSREHGAAVCMPMCLRLTSDIDEVDD